MSSNVYTMNDLQNDEKVWKEATIRNEFNLIQEYIKEGGLEEPYLKAEKNAWIVRTLRDKKERYKFDSCRYSVLVGSGMYPYSMFDLHKQYPKIKQIGIEIDSQRAKLSKLLIKNSPAKDQIKIENMDAFDYDYSWMGLDDFVFISVDVEHKNLVEKIIDTSKAHVEICAPYDKTWLVNSIKRSFTFSI